MGTVHHEISFRYPWLDDKEVALHVRYHFNVASSVALQGVDHRTLKLAFHQELSTLDARIREGLTSVSVLRDEFSKIAKIGVTIKVRRIPLHVEITVDSVRMRLRRPTVFKTNRSAGSRHQPRATRLPYTNPLRTPALQGVH